MFPPLRGRQQILPRMTTEQIQKHGDAAYHPRHRPMYHGTRDSWVQWEWNVGDPVTAAERVRGVTPGPGPARSRFTTNGLHQQPAAFRLLRNAPKTRDTQRASPAPAFISTPNGHLSLGDYYAHEMRHEFITLSRGIIWHTNQRPTSSTTGEPPARCPNHSSIAFPVTYNNKPQYSCKKYLLYSRLR